MAILKESFLRMQQEGVLDGQLRIGTSTPREGGGKKPVKLSTWLATSPSRRAIEAAAERFGGEVKPWDSDRGKQWQVTTPLAELPVYFGGGATVDQWMTHWDKGIPLRRCTGAPDAVNEISRRPCECNATGRELCKPETKLRVRFPDLPGIGWWRFTSHGKHVAGEFHEKAQMLLELAERGVYVPAFLVLREMKLPPKEPGGPGRRFPVVNIDIPVSIEDITLGRNGVGTLNEIMAARREALALEAGPGTSVAAALPAGNDQTPASEAPASALTSPPSTARPATQTQPEPDAAELARQAAAWARRPSVTREQIVSFLAKNGKSPAMDQFVPADGDGVESKLRDLLGDRLNELTPAQPEYPDGYDPELGMVVPPEAGVQPEELERLS